MTFIENVQLLLNPAASMLLYVIYVFPTFRVCGGSGPVRVKGSLELSLGSGNSHVMLAYDRPASVGVSISLGH